MSQTGMEVAIVHAGTLEALETVGLAETMIKKGILTNCIAYYGWQNELWSVDFSLLKNDTNYPFVVLISQQAVEEILLDELKKLGCNVIVTKL
ncbi:hypothetical protein M422DRAFT_253234 [Sphaerobolus stellatus SS14]|uniref:FAD-binding domain-containing protein n=1 Tax=Sphaerobolus stellatus (strain SS14) TaxID=990650 RepID=A0A0C9UJZ9_SPHS4|nr:hypothetical protein M422DRAFT_253234 [Sphaerobolus stellatus SS14]